MNKTSVAKALMTVLAGFGIGNAAAEKALPEAWSAWESGDIARTRELAEQSLGNPVAVDEARHLLFLTSFVSGDYEVALSQYNAIAPAYPSLTELAETVLEAYLHLVRVADALEFARAHDELPAWTVPVLERHATKPLRVVLDEVAIVPFADHPLTNYFPAFAAEINGQAVTAHVDTGGAFLHMGPERAKVLGIETIKGDLATAHLNNTKVEMSYGVADKFVLGDAVLDNVPVAVMSTLSGNSDFIVFGTNILERFLSTLDYANRRLILSPRGNETKTAEHLAMLPESQTRIPFYLWGDHFMFARGSAGTHDELNFFVDSGLVSLHEDSNGTVRQAAFTTSKRKLETWGVEGKEMSKGFVELRFPLALGPLKLDDAIAVIGPVGDNNFGGVRIDGLISHGFLSRYCWTIDFDRREYVFAGAQ